MYDDSNLLLQYARDGSETAFRGLVSRHIPLVFATARRLLAGDVHLAQDVTQLVFIDLARKATSLPADTVLGG
jgi:DNA-directed RNA polymerase specialized sigma24 family protein